VVSNQRAARLRQFVAVVADHVLGDLDHRGLGEPVQRLVQHAVVVQDLAHPVGGQSRGLAGNLAIRCVRAGSRAEEQRQADHALMADGGDFDEDASVGQCDQRVHRGQREVHLGDGFAGLIELLADLSVDHFDPTSHPLELAVR
jgi:hypothetical protein